MRAPLCPCSPGRRRLAYSKICHCGCEKRSQMDDSSCGSSCDFKRQPVSLSSCSPVSSQYSQIIRLASTPVELLHSSLPSPCSSLNLQKPSYTALHVLHEASCSLHLEFLGNTNTTPSDVSYSVRRVAVHTFSILQKDELSLRVSC